MMEVDWGGVVRIVGEEGGPEHHKQYLATMPNMCRQKFTVASDSISSVSMVTCTDEAPRSVGTHSISVTVVSGSIGTFIKV